MRIQVSGGKSGQPAKIYDTVTADTFDAAVSMVFRNKAMYPRVERVSQNVWAITVSSISNQITRIRVRCKRMKEETTKP